MHLKSYFSSTVESAIALAARDLGEDAMLVYSRASSPETQYLGKYEVVFALPPGQPPPASAVKSPLLAEPCAEPWGPAISSQMAKLDEKLNQIVNCIQGGHLDLALPAATTAAGSANQPFGAGPFERTPSCGPGADLYRAGPVSAWNLIETAGISGSACMIVGPAGAGKTTSVIKIATMMVALSEIQPRVASLDVTRIGGCEWLRTCSALVGLPFSALHTPDELAALLGSTRQGGPVILDSPPMGEFDPRLLSAVEEALTDGGALSVILALPATWKAADLRNAINVYSCLRPCAVVLTHLDQTEDCTPLFREVVSAGLPVALVSEGPRIPEDIRFASAEELTKIANRVNRDGQAENDMKPLRAEPGRAAVAA